MRAVVVKALGPIPQVEVAESSCPEPDDGEILVKIEARALNPLDAKLATGTMKAWFAVRLPYMPGTDFAGTVEAIGPGVTTVAAGDAVFGRTDPVRGGGLAEYVVLPAQRATHRPLNISAREAACLPTPAGIAWQALAPLLANDRHMPILLLGEGAVVEAAAAIGGKDVRRVTSPAMLDGLTGPHYLFDAVGGERQREAARRLPERSHIVSIVSPIDDLVAAERSLTGEMLTLQTDRRQLDAVAQFVGDGVLRPTIDRLAPFDQAADMFARYVARRVAGKIVLEGGSP